MTTAQSPGVDHRYDLLAASRRRHLLSLLCERGRLDLETVTIELAARETGTVDEPVSETARRRVRVALVHNHLPRLADHGILAYDLQTETIVPDEEFEALKPTVERLCDRVSAESGSGAAD